MVNNSRIFDHPVLGKMFTRKEISFSFDGQKFSGYEGDTIASALLAQGIRKLRVHEESGSPRGIYCNIGHCFECRVTVNGNPGIRACITELKADMVIESGKKQPSPFKEMDQTDDFPRTYTQFAESLKEKEEGEPNA